MAKRQAGAGAIVLLSWAVLVGAAEVQSAPCQNPRKLRLGAKEWMERYAKQDQKIYAGRGYTGKPGNHGMWWGWNENRVLSSYLVMYGVTGDAKYLDQAASHIDVMLPAAKDVNGDGIKLWLDGKGNEEPCDYNSSQIGEPIAHFARIVLTDEKLKARYGDKAAAYAKFVDENVVASFEKFYGQKWGEFTDGAGVFYSEDKDWQTKQPGKCSRHHNQYASKARIYLDLGAALNKPEYTERGTKMAKFFKRSMVLKNKDTDKEAYSWNYHTIGGEWDAIAPSKWCADGPEDIGHANTEIGFLVKAHRETGVFDATDLKRFVGTVLFLQWNGDEQEPLLNQYMQPGKDYNATGEIWDVVALAQFDGRLLGLFETIADKIYQQPDHYKEQKGDARPAEPAGILLALARLLEAAKVNEAALAK
jgi:hypothetical protein